MATVVYLQPGYYPDPTAGRPVSNADIYVGEPDTDPEVVLNQKQISVQQENGDVVEVSQPMHTGAGGVPIYNGSTVTILVDGDHSLKVLDSEGAQVYYVPEASGIADGEVTLSKLAPGTPGNAIAYDENGDASDAIINPLTYVDWINYTVNSQVFGSDGIEYQADIANGPASSIVDPVGDVTGTWAAVIVVTEPNTIVISVSDTYEKPDNLIYIDALGIGAGAGGGGVDGQGAVTWAGAGGGGAGARSRSLILAEDLAASETVTIGAKGTGGANGADGTDGGDTSFGSHIIAPGGDKGLGETAAALLNMTLGGKGGIPTVGDILTPGLDGGEGIGLTTGSAANLGGNGGGPGGGKSTLSDGNGSVAISAGGGGGGAAVGNIATNYTGGNGFDGAVIIIEYLGV